ncbi:MAG: tetratricopeptide repeat protein [Verrucomicrobiota bacterium]
MSPGALLKESLHLMEAKKYDEAVSTMYTYLDTVEESKAPRVIKIAQDIRFKLAGILIQEERLDEAAEVLEKYIELPLGKHPRQAMKMLATCYYEYGKPETPDGSPDSDAYERCAKAVLRALEYNENPVVVVKTVVEDSEGVQSLSDDDEEADPEYTQSELSLLYLTLGEVYFGLKKWKESIDPFTYVIENTADGQRKGYAIMQVVSALINIPDFDQILQWIPQLYRTEARFDIRVNIALMKAAAALYEAEEYDSALPLYRMILPRDELIAFQQEKLREMRIEAGLSPEEGMKATAEELLLFGEVSDEASATDAEGAEPEPSGPKKPKKLLELERLIEALEKLSDYESDIDYRMAQIYRDVDRYWEAVRFLDTVYAVDPSSELSERCIYEVISLLVENLKEVKEAEKRGFEYMAKNKEGMTPRQIAYMLTNYYQQEKEMKSILALRPYLDSFVRTNNVDIIKLDAELYFMQGVSDLMLLSYEKSEERFKYVLDEFPDSHQEGNALYWYGMSKLFMQKYEEARPVFEQYVSKFPEGDWIDEAYFQGGVCLFGLEKYKESLDRFSLVIRNYPDSPIIAAAASMRGDLYGAGMVYDKPDYLERAVADYKLALESAKRFKKVKQATYAVFQLAAVFEADAGALEDEAKIAAKYDEIIVVVQDYLDHWGAKANISKAAFWLGKTMIQQDRVDEAVKTYLDAIVKFGGDVREDGVDMMISELVKVSAIWLGVEAQGKLMDDLYAALEATDDPVLQLRLRVTMAKLDDTEIELGKRLIKELPDLDSASPPVLAAICDASFELKDYSRSEELLRIFIVKFGESDFIRAAFRLRGYGQFSEKDYEGALKTAEEALETYGHARDVAWAQLMKAQIYLEEGRIEEARDANMYILGIPEWRGEPVAQATYQMGLVEEKAGNLRKAFGFYQRTYFQYKGHAGGYWAAEAYLASARCLKGLGLEEDMRNTYRNMLFDPYVNDLPQAEEARKLLGAGESAEIETVVASGETTNIVIKVDTGGMEDTSLMKALEKKAEEMDEDVREPSEMETTTGDEAGLEGEL